MKYCVDGWNNFCRVFEVPDQYPPGFCTSGGKPVHFQMVDWFNPVPELPTPGVSKEVWEQKIGPIETKEVDIQELENDLIPFLRLKIYIKQGRQYLVLYNFGGSSTFSA